MCIWCVSRNEKNKKEWSSVSERGWDSGVNGKGDMIQEQVWPVEEGGRDVRREGRGMDTVCMDGWRVRTARRYACIVFTSSTPFT